MKFLFLSTLALVPPGGQRARRGRRRQRRALAPRCARRPASCAVPAALVLSPGAAGAASGAVAAGSCAAAPSVDVLRTIVAGALSPTGLLASAWRGARRPTLGAPRLALLPAAFALRGSARRPTPPSTRRLRADFYDLRPEMSALVDRRRRARPLVLVRGRQLAGLHWAPADPGAQLRTSWLYYMDRQRSGRGRRIVDGLDGAFDEDRTGLGAAGLDARRGRLAARALPRDPRASAAGRGAFRPVVRSAAGGPGRAPGGRRACRRSRSPLRLYELRDALPRAFWVRGLRRSRRRTAASARAPRGPVASTPSAPVLLREAPPGPRLRRRATGGARTVRFRRASTRTRVRLEAAGDAGFVVVLEGYHRDWVAESAAGVPLLRAQRPLLGHSDRGRRPDDRRAFASALAVRPSPRSRCGLLVALILLPGRRLTLDRSSSDLLASTD